MWYWSLKTREAARAAERRVVLSVAAEDMGTPLHHAVIVSPLIPLKSVRTERPMALLVRCDSCLEYVFDYGRSGEGTSSHKSAKSPRTFLFMSSKISRRRSLNSAALSLSP